MVAGLKNINFAENFHILYAGLSCNITIKSTVRLIETHKITLIAVAEITAEKFAEIVQLIIAPNRDKIFDDALKARTDYIKIVLMEDKLLSNMPVSIHVNIVSGSGVRYTMSLTINGVDKQKSVYYKLHDTRGYECYSAKRIVIMSDNEDEFVFHAMAERIVTFDKKGNMIDPAVDRSNVPIARRYLRIWCI